MLDPGQIAPDFSLDGFSLGGHLRGGPILAVFFKISCPTCQLTLPFLERLKSRVQIVGISQDDAASTKEFLDYFRIAFPVVIDPASAHYAVSASYRLTNVPSIFLIEPGGAISWALNGFHRADLEALADRFGAVLFTAEDHVPAMKPG